jgi:uncharacterized membrane protein HdeD (DUF308 family)
MDDNTGTYLAFVVLGVVLVIIVGQMLIRSGQVYLEETFPDRRVARSVSKLLAVMFYLFALGLLGIISTFDVPVEGDAQVVVTKLGVVLLVLGIVFAGTMLALSRIRSRRREEEEEEAMMAASMAAAPVHTDDTTNGDTTNGDRGDHKDQGNVTPGPAAPTVA